MDKFINCIYVLSHTNAFTYDNIDSFKIGSTKSLPHRMLNYKTYYPIDKIVIGYFHIINYDCYQLDNDIKIYFNNQRIKSNGGIEYYQHIQITDLESYFKMKDIKFLLYTDDDYKNVKWLLDRDLYKTYIDETINILDINIKTITQPNIDIKLREWQKKSCN